MFRFAVRHLFWLVILSCVWVPLSASAVEEVNRAAVTAAVIDPAPNLNSDEIQAAKQVYLLQQELAEMQRRQSELASFSKKASDLTSLGLMIVAVLIGVVGLLFPLVTYFTSIRPANNVIAEAKRTMEGLDNRFATLLESYRANQIEDALRRLEEGVDEERQWAANVIGSNADFAFSPHQVFRLTELLDHLEGPHIRYPLLNILANNPCKHSSRYFMRLAQEEGINDLHSVVRYAVTGKDRAIFDVLVNKSQADRQYLTMFLHNLMMVSRDEFVNLLNDKEFVAGVPVEVRQQMVMSLAAAVKNAGSMVSIDDLLFVPKPNKDGYIVSFWSGSGREAVEVSDPALAEEVRLSDKQRGRKSVKRGSEEFEELVKEHVAQFDLTIA